MFEVSGEIFTGVYLNGEAVCEALERNCLEKESTPERRAEVRKMVSEARRWCAAAAPFGRLTLRGILITAVERVVPVSRREREDLSRIRGMETAGDEVPKRRTRTSLGAYGSYSRP